MSEKASNKNGFFKNLKKTFSSASKEIDEEQSAVSETQQAANNNVLEEAPRAKIEEPTPQIVDKTPEIPEPVIPSFDLKKAMDMFAQHFTSFGGNIFYCKNETVFLKGLKAFTLQQGLENVCCYNRNLFNYLSNAEYHCTLVDNSTPLEVGFSLCENLISEQGNILFSSMQGLGKRLNVFPQTFIIVGFTSQIVAGLKEAVDQMLVRYQKNFPETLTTFNSHTISSYKQCVLFLIEDKENG